MSTFGAVFRITEAADPRDGLRIIGGGAGAGAGRSVAAAGDVNGDGIGDIVIGADSARGPLPGAGTVTPTAVTGAMHVVYGRADWGAGRLDLGDLDGADGFTVTGLGPTLGRFGWSVASAGDVNGDSHADLIAGAPDTNLAPGGYLRSLAGIAQIVFGAPGTVAPLRPAATLTGAEGTTLAGGTMFAYLGGSVAGIGDLDGDGMDDIAATGQVEDGLGRWIATAHVVYGRRGGQGEDLDAGTLGPATGFAIRGPEVVSAEGVPAQRGAMTVAAAGDVNGDGFSDMILGAPLADLGGTDSGAAWILFGRAGGYVGTLDLDTLGPAVALRIGGAAAGALAGQQVAGLGDVNGDGIDDVAIGLPGAGGAVVLFGRQGGWAAGIDLAALTPAEGFRIRGTGDIPLVAAAGDVNGDGCADILIGAQQGTVGLTGQAVARAHVIFGSSAGFAEEMRLADLDGHAGFAIEITDARPGTVVSGAGDINGDGYDDLLLGLPGEALPRDPPGGGRGAVQVIWGKATDGTAAPDRLWGSEGDDTLMGRGGVDTLIGRGGNDVLDGGIGGDLMQGGAGADLYHVDNPGDRIDESRRGAGRDTVIAAVNYDMRAAAVEDLILTGGARTGIGNARANTLTGTGGADTLDGGAGRDLLIGGAGDDRLILRNPGDRVTERADGGHDTILAFRSLTLPRHVEDLHLQGAGAWTATGNAAANRITGNAADNTIAGRDGRDILRGGAGADTFVFDSAMTAAHADRITDFDRSEGDRLRILATGGGAGLFSGVLPEDRLVTGTAATDPGHRFVHDPMSGWLWFDRDGTGRDPLLPVVQLAPLAALTAEDILIF